MTYGVTERSQRGRQKRGIRGGVLMCHFGGFLSLSAASFDWDASLTSSRMTE